jgi:hypothetical protein
MGIVGKVLALLGGRAPSHRTHIDIVVYLAAWSCEKGAKHSGLILAKKATAETYENGEGRLCEVPEHQNVN